MKAVIITDKDYQTGLFQKLKGQTLTVLSGKEYAVEFIEVGRDDLAFCMGCFGCWIKKPGECVIDDMMAKINRSYVNSDMFIYLTPVVFGQFSANIKNAVDRWLPNILPFFITRPDGSTMHPSRYDKLPKTVIIGYGDGLLPEDAELFTDITKKHRMDMEVLVFQGDDANLAQALDAVVPGKVG